MHRLRTGDTHIKINPKPITTPAQALVAKREIQACNYLFLVWSLGLAGIHEHRTKAVRHDLALRQRALVAKGPGIELWDLSNSFNHHSSVEARVKGPKGQFANRGVYLGSCRSNFDQHTHCGLPWDYWAEMSKYHSQRDMDWSSCFIPFNQNGSNDLHLLCASLYVLVNGRASKLNHVTLNYFVHGGKTR